MRRFSYRLRKGRIVIRWFSLFCNHKGHSKALRRKDFLLLNSRRDFCVFRFKNTLRNSFADRRDVGNPVKIEQENLLGPFSFLCAIKVEKGQRVNLTHQIRTRRREEKCFNTFCLFGLLMFPVWTMVKPILRHKDGRKIFLKGSDSFTFEYSN